MPDLNVLGTSRHGRIPIFLAVFNPPRWFCSPALHTWPSRLECMPPWTLIWPPMFCPPMSGSHLPVTPVLLLPLDEAPIASRSLLPAPLAAAPYLPHHCPSLPPSPRRLPCRSLPPPSRSITDFPFKLPPYYPSPLSIV